jgi:DNA-binding PadR family transcriptional regulator
LTSLREALRYIVLDAVAFRDMEVNMRPCGAGCGPGGAQGPGDGPGRRHMHGGGHGPRHGGRFFERGGIRFAILDLLKDKPRHGYDMIREMEERSGGFYSPSPGAVYPTLQALEDQDLVSATTEEGKKVYAITEAGIAYLEEHKDRASGHRERWQSHWAGGREGEAWEAVDGIRGALGEVRRAIRESAGDPGKLKEIDAVLRDAAARIREVAGK